ncbi:ISNCY-like element ISA1214-6 family transposase [Archaeoglobus fulgidus]|uniref:ISA1214-6, putative transposase n=1 Tax=Archaeoglobus fulgidus (strain ATCC 49558 / DSM 4304 / JCM 9628 / NBRC 100126 / VC-16) TaxID=224325 RepID=O28061_ARCFU|nr:ISNCY-like element ISA1214-6 family transposase [Archaeoglobus fulgidus]AAB89033.1 ISA1214-6, putative transposase [Archaeoglobus fulgidus DSM 4304]
MNVRITKKMVRELLEVLDEIVEEIRQEEKEKYPYAEWERKREIVKERLRKLPKYVREAVSAIRIEKRVGRPKKVDLEKRVMLFLFARLINKSNRDVEELLELFEPLFGIRVSYKTIERLYSDEEVRMALHNLFILLLKDEGVSGEFSGDGTGYSLAITKHYRSNPKKKGKDFRYVFRIIDLETGMYVGFGYSAKSEKDAFEKAMKMLKSMGVKVNSISLDKYYSTRKTLRMFDAETSVYVIPKRNLSRIGFDWLRVIERIVEMPYRFLKRYFKRNLSEAGFSADKRRFGWLIRQRREDRREMALFAVGLWHNIFAVRVMR